jgi:hypothetical protein
LEIVNLDLGFDGNFANFLNYLYFYSHLKEIKAKMAVQWVKDSSLKKVNKFDICFNYYLE